MKKISPELDLELCAFLSGWHDLEQKRGNTDHIIDMNLTPLVEPKPYTYRYDVLVDIEKFLDNEEVKSHPQISARMVAHQYFLQKTMGQSIPYNIYLKNTMGIEPIYFTEAKVAALQENVSTLLEPFGLEMKEGISTELEKFDEKIEKDQIISFFNDQHEEFFSAINPYIGSTAEFKLHYSEIDENVGKVAEIRGDGVDYDLLFNLYHMKNYRSARLKLLSAHEITGHGVQFALLRQKIEQGDIPRYMGYTTTHDPSLFQAEGLAETVQYFYPEQFDQSPVMQANMAIHRLKRVVINNAVNRINEGASFKECATYMYERAPDHSVSRIANNLENFANKPLGSSYYTIYGQALESFLEISGSHADKNAFIHSAYHDYLMPQDIQSQVKRNICEFI